MTARTLKLQRSPGALRGGFTLVELLVAVSLGGLVVGTPVLLLLESAMEERRGLADATVEQVASKLQSQIVVCLRAMSAREGVIFSVPMKDADGASLGFSSIIIARGPAPDYPREQISFDPAAGRVLYYPNRSQPNAAIAMAQNQPGSVVRQVTFWPSVKPDGTPDNSLINVLIKLDDNGSSGRTSMPNSSSIWRTFSVRMRND